MEIAGRHFSGQHAAVRDGEVYIFGGSSDFSCQIYDDVARYDPSTDEWTVLPSQMTVERKGVGSALLGDQLYIFGGHRCSPAGQCPGVGVVTPGQIPNCPIAGAGTNEVGEFVPFTP